MESYKLFFIFTASFISISAASIEVDCEIMKNPDYLRLFDTLKAYFNETSQECGFKVEGSENSSEINFDFPIDEKLKHVTFVYTTTEIPILPAELFEKVPDKKVMVGFYNLASIKIERDWFKHSENLTHLFFFQNRIPRQVSGKFLDLKKLKSINLQYNFLKEIDVGAFTGLNHLDMIVLNYNELEYLHPDLFRNLDSLKLLYIFRNLIKELDVKVFGNLVKLEILDLSSNKLEYLPKKLFENSRSLKTLYLDRNPIKSLQENQFKNLVNLELITFSQAQFTTVPDGIFKNNGNLARITMQANISRMSNKIFSHLTKLNYIFLGDNYCVSVGIKEHNLSIFFTEELLIPCSCKLLVNDDKLDFKPRRVLIFGIAGVSISAIFFLLLKKVKFPNSLWTRDGYLIMKNGKL
jgi:Leucine-rich repeat (LRR) protein